MSAQHPHGRRRRPRPTRPVAAVLAVFAAAVLPVAAWPAKADVMPALRLRPGQRVVIEATAPVGQGKGLLTGNLGPTDCSTPVALLGSEEFCHSYPVALDAPDALIREGALVLSVTLEFGRGAAYVPNCPQLGNCGSNEMGLELWQSPPKQERYPRGPAGEGECDHLHELPEGPVKDEVYANPDLCAEPTTASEGPTVASRGSRGSPDSPLSVAHVGAGVCAEVIEPDPDQPLPADGICRVEHVGVGNYLGGGPYRLTIELVDATGSGPVDRSIDIDPPLDAAPTADAPPDRDVAAVEPPPDPVYALPAFPRPASGAPAVDLPGLGASGGFDRIGEVQLGGDLTRKILERGPKPLGPPGDPNLLSVVLWLALVPLGAVCPFVVPVVRRRREGD